MTLKATFCATITIAATLASTSLRAQNPATQPKDTVMNRTVVVEQDYIPEIEDARKVNVLPQVVEPAASKKEVRYATAASPAANIPTGTLPSYVAPETQAVATPGFVRAGFGNYGNVDLLGNYLFRPSTRDKLNVRLGVEGMNGRLGNALPETGEKWKSHHYRTKAGLDYSHQFDQFDLDVAGHFGLSNFNLLPMLDGGNQKFTSGTFRVALRSTDEAATLRFRGETNLLLYGRKLNPLMDNANAPTGTTGINETLLRTKVAVSGDISDGQSVTVTGEMSNYWYGGQTSKSYTALDLNPSYALTGDEWRLRAGAHIDLSFGFDKLIRVAPDIMVQYLFSDSYVLYAQATGGKRLNDFRRLETLSPYAAMDELPTATYEQLNAAIGFKASPYPAVWLNLTGGYQRLTNDLACVPFPYIYVGAASGPPLFYHDDTYNYYLGGQVSYAYKDLFTVAASYTYRNWTADSEEFLLVMKPESEASVNIGIHPIPALRVDVGFDYIGRRKVGDTKVNAVSDLHANVGYDLFKGVAIYARLGNLLNKKYAYYLGYPTEGFNLLGGLSFKF
ncbi:MAG: TonB-dependent receptor [Mediterranea sp.]|nr:TonB-dependent receptor [Mediterranea sp.]